jgi:L,D-peptidoglycan transpeptidase YkuD (ErfK/YbiS/YcfS/YnhG family)
MRLSAYGRKIRTYVLTAIILLFLTTGTIWIYIKWPNPPVKELRAANDALMSAKEAEAEKYAPQLYKTTSKLYESAMQCWKAENEKFILNRNFAKARAFAFQTTQKGAEARKIALNKANSIRQNTGTTLSELENIRKNFEKYYYPLPLPKSVRENYHKAVFLMTEARLARDRSELPLAQSKLEEAKYLMTGSAKNAQTMLENYFSLLAKWRSDVNRAIQQSANQNAPLLIVNKMEHQCLLYVGGILKRKFDAEFGPNWIGDKMYRGDRATPEGIYRIVHKKDQRRTIYHKALAINYPNDEDRTRFRNNVASGVYSRRHDIGGSIEIHGSGGRGFNWTKGCVALTDNDIDIVYNMVTENTPVVIIGAIDPLEKYIN